MNWPFVSIDDLTPADIEAILARADRFRAHTEPWPTRPDAVIGLVFFEPSLRTRAGYRAAAARLGAQVVEVTESRSSPISMGESWDDTVRVVAGYSDVVVGRVDTVPGRLDTAGRPFISGGHRGASPEHPTQALADLFAIRSLLKREPEHVALIGDPGMRSARSLIKLLRRTTAARVSVVSHPTFIEAASDATASVDVAERLPADADVVYVTGMLHDSLPLNDRNRLIVSPEMLGELRADALVLSPMPVIDEIDDAARRDERVGMYTQSDLALFVRMAVLEAALPSPDGN